MTAPGSDAMTDLAELKRLAEAATKGPWTAERGDGELDLKARFPSQDRVLIMANGDCEDHPIADASCNYTCRLGHEQAANAAFIAALNPATALALIARVEDLEGDRTTWKAAFIEAQRSDLADVNEEMTRLRALLEEAVKALEPFVRVADSWDSKVNPIASDEVWTLCNPEGDCIPYDFTVADFRLARQALAAIEKGGE